MQNNTQLLYGKFPEQFVFDKKHNEWKVRQRKKVYGRLSWVEPKNEERYCLRLLLLRFGGLTGFENLLQLEDRHFMTFKERCIYEGLWDNDETYTETLQEASSFKNPKAFMDLFVLLLNHTEVTNCKQLFENFINQMISKAFPDKNSILNYISSKLDNKSLSDFGLPTPSTHEERGYYDKNNQQFTKKQIDDIRKTFKQNATTRQKELFDNLMMVINDQKDAFLIGGGGNGKSYTVNAVRAELHFIGFKPIAVSSTGISANALGNCVTSHKFFGLNPLNSTSENYTIKSKSSLSKCLLNPHVNVVFWDEIFTLGRSLVEQVCMEVNTLRTQSGLRRISFIFVGGPEQFLPVIRNAGEIDQLRESMIFSPIFENSVILNLQGNSKRLFSRENSNDFEDFVKILKGSCHSNEEFKDEKVQIPSVFKVCNDANTLSNFVYPQNILYQMTKLRNYSDWFYKRAVLFDTNEQAQLYNEKILERYPGLVKRTYHGTDTIDMEHNITTSPEVTEKIFDATLPKKILTLSEGIPLMLLKNLSVEQNCTNGSLFRLKTLGKHILVLQSPDLTDVFIPKIFCKYEDLKSGIVFKRKQFPIHVSFGVTSYKVQGGSYQFIGIMIPERARFGFNYVSVTRATNVSQIMFCTSTDNERGITNRYSPLLHKRISDVLKN
jgi:hypothetical protein